MGCYQSTQREQAPTGPLRGVNVSAQTARTLPGAVAAPAPPPRVKLVLLGDSGVGKSCLVLRYVRNAFDPASKITVGAAFMSHNVALPDGKSIKFEIWDTAGQERYLSLAPLYYRGAHAAAIVYDVTSMDSFEKAKYWIRELKKNATSNLVMILVGNKTDLSEQRQVTDLEGREYADRTGMLFVETSAKTAANCAEVFESVAAKLAGGLPVSSSAGTVGTVS